MTTAQQQTIPLGADAKLRVTVESNTREQPVGKEDSQASIKQILASLAETKKYLPNQVYTFLDSMEGKTVDDLRLEAMHLANKAQEEAKKRASDVTTYGKSIVENANQKVQNAADMARERTNDYATGLANKGLDIVQPPIEKTKEVTRSLAMRGWTMAKARVMPYVQPVVNKAQEYVPSPAKEFYETNINGKGLDEIGKLALTNTRKNLLSVKEPNPATVTGVASEVKDAVMSGAIWRNALQLSENAANQVFGKTEVPVDTSALRRMYNLSFKVSNGLVKMVNEQMYGLSNQTRSMLMSPVNQLQLRLTPIWERIAATPVIPEFVYRALREEKTKEGESSKKETPSVQKVPVTSVKVDIVGMQAKEAPQTSTSSSGMSMDTKKDSSDKSATLSTDLKSKDVQSSESKEIGNTNAQGKGEQGSAGMGVTTTGAESEDQTKKSKKHHKQ